MISHAADNFIKSELLKMNKFNLVVCAGTFDLFHKGHKEFLHFAQACAKKLIIGLTSDRFEDNKRDDVEPYKVRRNNVFAFLKKERADTKVEIVPINNIFGPTLSPTFPIKAIVVSEVTLLGATLINKHRKKYGLAPLEILICPFTLSEDRKPIASSRIRDGEIDREGKLWIQPVWFKKKLRLPLHLRKKLKRPVGILYKNGAVDYTAIDAHTTITVGDVVTKTCNDLSFKQKISVIDFHVGREKKFVNLSELGFVGDEQVLTADNPAGSLTPSLFRCAHQIFHMLKTQKRIVVKVNGEEDLAVLPMLLACPLGFIILYGQPNQGVVKITVSEEKKTEIFRMVSHFDQY